MASGVFGAENRMLEFGGGDRSGAAFHHHEPARVVREPRRIGKRRIAGDAECERRDNSVAGAGYVDWLLRSDRWNIKRCGVAFQQHHALWAARHEQCLVLYFVLERPCGELQLLLQSHAMAHAVFEFIFVWRGRSEAFPGTQTMT